MEPIYRQMPEDHQVEYDEATANSTIYDQINLLLDKYRDLATQGLLVDSTETSQSLATQRSMASSPSPTATKQVTMSNEDPATDDVWTDIPFTYTPTTPVSSVPASIPMTNVAPSSTSWYPPYGRQVEDKPAVANSWP